MIERQMSADHVNQIVNHPSIHPWVCGPTEEPLDLTGPIESGNYIALFGEHGGFLFYRVSDGIYDAHSAVLPSGRGKWAIRAARDALHWIFEREQAREVLMAVPHGNVAVRALVRILKARFQGTIENGWWRDGHAIPTDIYSMTRADFETCQ